MMDSTSRTPAGRAAIPPQRIWQTGPWADKLLWLAVALLPFQQGLTLDVGFPLKPSEVLGGVGVLVALLERRGRVLSARGAKLVLALAGVVFLSSAWTAATTDGSERSAAYPHGLFFDLAQYTAYAFLALGLCLCVASLLSPGALASALGWGVRLALIYAILQLGTWAVGSDILSLVNGNQQLGSQYGIRLPRNGPFREGNYLGFFAATSLFFLVRTRDVVGVLAAVLVVFYSQSTGAMLGIFVAVAAGVILRPRVRKFLIAGVVAAAGLAAFLAIPAVNRLVLGQLTKLGLIENKFGASYGYSLRARTVNAETGFSMALQNPVFGVGQGRYALHYWDYIDLTGLPENFNADLTRPIANNVYSQLGAETGMIALAIFVALLVLLGWYARARSSAELGAVVAIAVGLIAFPAWTGITAWVMIAAVMSFVSEDCEDERSSPRGAKRKQLRKARRERWSWRLFPRWS